MEKYPFFRSVYEQGDTVFEPKSWSEQRGEFPDWSIYRLAEGMTTAIETTPAFWGRYNAPDIIKEQPLSVVQDYIFYGMYEGQFTFFVFCIDEKYTEKCSLFGMRGYRTEGDKKFEFFSIDEQKMRSQNPDGFWQVLWGIDRPYKCYLPFFVKKLNWKERTVVNHCGEEESIIPIQRMFVHYVDMWHYAKARLWEDVANAKDSVDRNWLESQQCYYTKKVNEDWLKPAKFHRSDLILTEKEKLLLMDGGVLTPFPNDSDSFQCVFSLQDFDIFALPRSNFSYSLGWTFVFRHRATGVSFLKLPIRWYNLAGLWLDDKFLDCTVVPLTFNGKIKVQWSGALRSFL